MATLALAIVGQACFLSPWFDQISQNGAPPTTFDIQACQPANVPADYTYVSGVGAYKVHAEATDWNSARHVCKSEGGYLAIINSEAESAAIADLFRKLEKQIGAHDTNYTLVGFTDQYVQDEYLTIKGETLAEAGFDVWADNEPNNERNRERCGSILYDGKLNDISCDFHYTFVCEFADPYISWDAQESVLASRKRTLTGLYSL